MGHLECARWIKMAVTPMYTCQSDIVTTIKNSKKNYEVNDPGNQLGSKIATCNRCTSPKSRIDIHENNGFERYESQMLNIILHCTMKIPNLIYDLNTGNEDGTRYETSIAHGQTLQ